MKRVLIVYHSFDEWEMGPIRLRRIARQLPAAGWQPVVLTSERSARTAAEIPEGMECLRAGGIDLAEVYGRIKRLGRSAPSGGSDASVKLPARRNNKLTSFINRWFMVPDKQITWKRAAVNVAREYLRNHPVDVIFASLAPRTNLLVAAELAREFNLPCVMEFRDLWTGSPYYHLAQPSALHRCLHRRLERRVIQSATRVSAVCRGIAAYLDQSYARQLKQPVALNYNFFDPSEYPPATKPPVQRPMIVSYIGAMYASRSPLSFFQGLKRFIDVRGLGPNDVRFRWAGSVIGVDGVDEAIHELGLEPFIDRLGQLKHADALRELCTSDASVLIQAPSDAIHIPGKLFEALGASVPMLAIADEGEVRDILTAANAGVVCPHTPDGISNALDTFWQHHQEGGAWSFDESVRASYRNDRVVARLAGLFDEAIQDHVRPH